MLYKARPKSNTFSKSRSVFGEPLSPIKPNLAFIPIPAGNVQPGNLTYDIANVLTATQIASINNAGYIVFHSVGDTGGVNGTQIQDELAVQMENQITAVANPQNAPVFFYHLGDVVYL